MRAAHLFAPAHAGRRFVVWGASQGGQAALFTGQDAPTYAPELELLGVAAAAPATDLVRLFQLNRNGPFGRILSAYTLAMWSLVYPQLRLGQVLTRPARRVVKRIAKICINVDHGPIAATIVSNALKISYLRRLPWETEPWRGLLIRNDPGQARIEAPTIITQGGADKLIRPEITAAFVKRLCRQGDTVDYRTYAGIDHIHAGPKTAAGVAKWISDRFAGKRAPTVCA